MVDLWTNHRKLTKLNRSREPSIYISLNSEQINHLLIATYISLLSVNLTDIICL